MKKLFAIVILCSLIAGCNFRTGQDPETNQTTDEPKTTVAFYNVEEKIANNTEFREGSKIEEIKLTDENINNLALLGKVWGYLKYYHPNVAQGKYVWDYELFRIMPKIIEANNPDERDAALSSWILSQGEFEVRQDTQETAGEIKLRPDLEWISTSEFSDDVVSQLMKIKDGKRSYNYYVSLEPNVGNPDFKNENPYITMKYPDTGYRLLALFRYWNIIEYYFPYRYLIEEDWDDVLKEFIPKFVNASDQLEYKLAVTELIARINDTHAIIMGNADVPNHYEGVNFAPLEISFIQNKAVVTNYYNDINNDNIGEKTGLKIGDIITKVNGRTVEDLIDEKSKYISASNYPAKLSRIAPNLLRTNDTYLDIEYIHEGITETATVQSYHPDSLKSATDKQPGASFRLIGPDIGYIHLGSLGSGYLDTLKSNFDKMKGLILDLRCYPSDFAVFKIGECLVPEKTEFVKFSIGSITDPGLFAMTDSLTLGSENNDYYNGKVVILVNENTISQAEYTAMAFRTAPKATVIGSTTAGSDGNISYIYLPGGIQTMITGIGVYYPDGGETQRIGIIPDIEISPTIEGIKAGRDEVLEKAIEAINED